MNVKDITLTKNALAVLERRYLAKDTEGRVSETPEQLFRRVAECVASVDAAHDGRVSICERAEVYYGMMASFGFLPNSPTLMNAGTKVGQLSACFVIPVEDSIAGIFGAVTTMAEVHKSGGGTGFSFSRLRPKDDIVGSTGGVASGPVSFMKIFDQATDVIKQGGRRRGANMGILRVDHPDIMEFIGAKETGEAFRNFNLSVAVTDTFMERLEKNEEYPLVNPRNSKVTGWLRAGEVWKKMTEMAWLTGDPGVIFIDRMNRANPTPQAGAFEATNPCGEQPLLPFESCNLGSINLKNVVAGGDVDWEKLRRLVRDGVQFLDGVIDANRYPQAEIQEMTHANRKIGLGVMGLAEALIRMGIPYASEQAVRMGEKIMKFISEEGVRKSMELGRERGSFPNFKGSVWAEKGFEAMRNATVTTVAPTGTISIIAGASSGIEPLFAVSYVRRVMDGTELVESSGLFEEAARKAGIYSEALMDEVVRRGTVRDVDGVPEDMKKLFATALDIEPKWHIRMQAAFQKHTDNAVSKTINLPAVSTPEDVEDVYLKAYSLGCKGITVYRYGAQDGQVLSYPGLPRMTRADESVKVDSEYAGECRVCSV
ncbi:MAG: adenosylcobalamin-dependent ribonucleoside-diphosphate reductase [Nitrospirae bacterium]|nr:adenosylcobalamin-dependent ribonucleoside-diphosphate reductase [Nitrospirota bacterium]